MDLHFLPPINDAPPAVFSLLNEKHINVLKNNGLQMVW